MSQPPGSFWRLWRENQKPPADNLVKNCIYLEYFCPTCQEWRKTHASWCVAYIVCPKCGECRGIVMPMEEVKEPAP